ncbi:MAG: ATP-binding protein [Sphingobium sp.]|nr:ATP-binding protein [Sphingobium sp.]
MSRGFSSSVGLLGRLIAILLLTVVLEFAVGTLIYERASHLSLQEDDAKRLAEHLVIARKLMHEAPRAERRALAVQLTTERYEIHWTASLPAPPLAPDLDKMRRQILSWEPSLARSNLRLRLASPGRHSEISGGLRLPDGSWLYFGMHHAVGKWEFTLGRMGLALIPVLALLFAGGLLIRRTLAPLRDLAQATERIGLQDRVEVQEAGTEDVRHLIRAFNVMQGRIHRLIAERTETLAAVGHDLRTPLARLQLRLEELTEPAARAAIATDVAEMTAMIDSLLAFLGGERDPETRVHTDLAVMLATIVDNLQDQGHDVDYDGPDHLDMAIRPSAMRRAFGNLVENALHYGDRARISLVQEGGQAIIRVEDDGPGIPDQRLADVLKPFTRLDQARQRNTRGLGLGLAIVDRAVEQEGGVLRLANRPEGGLRVEIRLKLAA